MSGSGPAEVPAEQCVQARVEWCEMGQRADGKGFRQAIEYALHQRKGKLTGQIDGLQGLLPEKAGSELWQDLQYSKICGRAERRDPHVNTAFTRATKRT